MTKSDLTVIIVGLGIGGLAAAIECHRRGYKVIGLEKKPDTNQLGLELTIQIAQTLMLIAPFFQATLSG